MAGTGISACTVDILIYLPKSGASRWCSDKESVCNAGDSGLIPESRRSPIEGHGNPLQYFLPAESHRPGSLAGYSLWDLTESDTTEQLTHICTQNIATNSAVYAVCILQPCLFKNCPVSLSSSWPAFVFNVAF